MCIINLTLNGMVSCPRLKLGVALFSGFIHENLFVSLSLWTLRWWIPYTRNWFTGSHLCELLPATNFSLFLVPLLGYCFFPQMCTYWSWWTTDSSIKEFTFLIWKKHLFVLHSYWWQGCCMLRVISMELE